MESNLGKLYSSSSKIMVKLDHGTIIGILSGFGLVLAAIVLGGGLASFFDFKSLLIVCGGTLGACLVAFPLEDLSKTLTLLRTAFLPSDSSAEYRLRRLIDIAWKVRKQGALALKQDVFRESDPFLLKCIELIMDGVHAEDIRRTLEIELSFLGERHRRGAEIFQTMGAIAPAMGLIGTLIGLIQMLKHIDQPAGIGPAMALAVITTFYGAILANLVFFPLATKLKARSEEEALIKEMTIEGILCILDGVNPRLVEQRLECFLPPERRASQFG